MKIYTKVMLPFFLLLTLTGPLLADSGTVQLSSPVTILDGSATIRVPTAFARAPDAAADKMKVKAAWYLISGKDEAVMTISQPLPGIVISEKQLKEFTEGVKEQLEDVRVSGQPIPQVKTLTVNGHKVYRVESVIKQAEEQVHVIMQTFSLHDQVQLVMVHIPVKLKEPYLAAGRAALDSITW